MKIVNRIGIGIAGISFTILGYGEVVGAERTEPSAVYEERDSLAIYRELEEVTVTTKRKMTKLIEGGYSYNLGKDPRAATENLFDALNLVPMLRTTPDGSISVKGKEAFQLYVNGRPYDIGMNNPAETLRSIPGNKIARIEVITDPNPTYGNVEIPIINIITKEKALDGYSLNIGGSGATNPSARGNALFMLTKGKLEAAASYSYDLRGERNQEMNQRIDYLDDTGIETGRVTGTGTGDGNWHTHTMRLMLKYDIDSLNSVYADGHGLLTRTTSNNSWHQKGAFGEKISDIRFESDLDTHAGTVEANAIYRNYFKHIPNRVRFLAGYRFSYNPDNQDYTLSETENETYSRTLQHTKGGMSIHQVRGSLEIPLGFGYYNSLFLDIDNSLRLGHTDSGQGPENGDIYHDALRHTQDIASATVAYMSAIRHFTFYATVRGEYSHLRISRPGTELPHHISNDFLLLPSASVQWSVSQNTFLRLSYSERMTRPSIQQLNPFHADFSAFISSEGNPDLKGERRRRLNLNLFQSIGQLSISADAIYTHTSDMIASFNRREETRIITTFGNVGSADTWEGSVNLYWRPKSFLAAGAYVNFGYRTLNASIPTDLRQYDWFYNIAPHVDLFLPKGWTVNLNYGIFKSLPSVGCGNRHVQLYSLALSKSFFNGALTLTANADKPFSRHIKTVHTRDIPGLRSSQTNYTTGRAFSLTVSYTLREGRDVRLERSRALSPEDIKSGVD